MEKTETWKLLVTAHRQDETEIFEKVNKRFGFSLSYQMEQLTLENVNAANRTAIQYGFSASMFDLMGQNDFVPPNNTNPDYDSLADESVYGQFYFSDHADSEKDYYSFMLEPGKSLSVQLGFFVERKFVEEQDLYLKLGAIRNNLCGIALQPMKK